MGKIKLTINTSESNTSLDAKLDVNSAAPNKFFHKLKHYLDRLMLGKDGGSATLTCEIGQTEASGTVTCANVLAGDTVTVAGQTLTGVSGSPGANQFNVGVKASRAIQDLTYTADLPGSAGNSISVTYTAPGSGTNPLSVGVVGNAITVNLETTAVATATGSLGVTTPIVLTSVASGAARNTDTFTLEVAAAAANPTNTILADFTGTADAIVCTVTPNDGTNNPVAAATATLNLTSDIIFTSVAAGSARNTDTFTLQVLAAAANPTDTILADFTGTGDAIVCTITPNDGTNNGATPVDLTTAELRELINTGAVVGKTVTVTDGGSLRALQTATGGDATALADAGEGDGEIATFSGGTNPAVNLTTAELRELINSGTVGGKTVTVTDGSSLRALQTATGGDATNLADSGEGDGEVATFSGGADFNDAISTATQIKAAVDGSGAAAALVDVTITGTGSNVQTAAASQSLTGGSGTNTTVATSLVAAVAANATLNASVSASSALGVVTITSRETGDIGNLITLASSNGTRLATSGATLSGGTDDTTSRTYNL